MKKIRQQEVRTNCEQERIHTNADEEWYDNADLKRLFNLCDSTLYRLRVRGELPFYKLGGKICYPKSYFNKTMLEKSLNRRL